LCAEQPLNNLTHRAAPARLRRNVVRNCLYFTDCVAYGNRHSSELEGGYVCQVVAHHTALMCCQAFQAKYFLEGRSLIQPALENALNTELGRTMTDRATGTATDDGHSLADPLPVSDSCTVADVKSFRFYSIIVDVNPAFRHHAIHVENE
jgi:hypothetical protein